MYVRRPAVAGIFYPSDKESLLSSIRDIFLHKEGPKVLPPSNYNKRVFSIIVPHAAYIYSGPVASHAYYYISCLKPDLLIIIGPNHYGIGSAIATMRDAIWNTPLGNISLDNESINNIVKISGIIDIDNYAHSKDHSLEVQLPILQFIYNHEFKILPIILWLQDLDTIKDVGKAIVEIAKQKNTLLIASSDFTHYEPNEIAHKKDLELINTIKELDLSRFYTILERLDISACGYGAIAAVMYASKLLGATKAELLKYATSGDISNNKESVVGYAAMIIS